MMEFGFGISPSSTVDLDKVDLEKFEILHEMQPHVYKCMGCGSCSATCPASGFSGMSLRKVILDLQRGREKEAVGLLRNCMLCGKCTMVCPRGINTRHLILSVCKLYGED